LAPRSKRERDISELSWSFLAKEAKVAADEIGAVWNAVRKMVSAKARTK
jgi:hypothetical protein